MAKSIFTIGSCFALEINRVLAERKRAVHPEFSRLPDIVSKRNLAWYNTYSIAYEFLRCFGKFPPQYAECWYNAAGQLKGWQEPLRRVVTAATLEELKRYSEAIDTIIANGIRSSKYFIITLGMSECWRHTKTGNILAAHPRYMSWGKPSGGDGAAVFHNSTVEDNVRNLDTVCSLLKENIPEAQIIFTVSPVPFSATGTSLPVLEANAISKKKMKDAAVAIVAKWDNARYFDSFEFCMKIHARKALYQKDGRHVRPEVVAQVVDRCQQQFPELFV